MLEHQAELKFRVTSLDPEISAGQLIADLSKRMADLEQEVGVKYGYVQIEAEREKSIPIDPVTGYLIVKFIGAAIAGGFLKKLGEDSYSYLKKIIRNGSVELEQ